MSLPNGFRAVRVSPAQILLNLTISNKCGQSFRWHERRFRLDPALPHCSHSDGMKYVKQEPREDSNTAPNFCESCPSGVDRPATPEWSFCLSDRVVVLRQDAKAEYILHKTLFPGGKVASELENDETEAWLRDYLNLQVPLEELYQEWSGRDPVFAELAGRFEGLRMLRQDPWECLISFICSSNNNIARIGQMVQNLCTHFSPCLLSVIHETDGVDGIKEEMRYHPFPSPIVLAEDGVESRLRELGFGYRAKYVAATARMLCEAAGVSHQSERPRSTKRRRTQNGRQSFDDSASKIHQYLLSLRRLPYEDAKKELLRFPGVGPKVADCILLMSLDQPESIPVDRHVFAFAEKKYRIRSKNYDDIANRLRQLWGVHAGWAHSILFTAELRAFRDYERAISDVKTESFDPEEASGHGALDQVAKQEDDDHIPHAEPLHPYQQSRISDSYKPVKPLPKRRPPRTSIKPA